jgi:hypothetical protein
MKRHVMKTSKGAEVQVHVFLTSTLDGGFISRELYPLRKSRQEAVWAPDRSERCEEKNRTMIPGSLPLA